MSTYIMLVNYTDQGIANVKSSPKRADAARFLAKSCGAELQEVYLTLGIYDLVLRVEADDDKAVARFSLALDSLGNVRSLTMKAFAEDQYREIIRSLP